MIEPATSGRAKCRGCNLPIAKGEMRLGERLPNAFGDGEMTLWFHLRCGAYLRPETFVAAVGDAPADEVLTALVTAARFGIAHRRVPRVHGAERATSGRAHCRACRELIAKDEWRLALVFFDEYRVDPGGYLHLGCARTYFETTNLLDRIHHFSPELGEPDLAELSAALAQQN
jgi:hypothetical protein